MRGSAARNLVRQLRCAIPAPEHSLVEEIGVRGSEARPVTRTADVPMLEYPQLTRAIYFTARAGRVIPEELFVAVATVLAFVFQLERAVADGIVQPAVDVPPTHRFDPEGRRQA